MTVELRKLGDADLPLLEKWLHTDHVAKWYEHPQDWIYEIEHRETEFSWIRHFIAVCDDAPIGFCQYYEYCMSGESWHKNADINGAYSIDYLIGEKSLVGRGLGRKMIIALLERISAETNASCVIVQPDERNKASRAVLLSAGFCYDAENALFRFDL